MVGHVFIVTAASHGFVRKSCNVCFPELLKVLDDLQVTIIYARPQGVAELDEPIEHWKEPAFRMLLQASYERPLPPQLARFYDSQGWQNILSFGDQWTDHTSLLKTAKAFGLDAPIKTVKAQDGLTPEALGQQLRLVGRMLPSLADSWTGCSYDLDDPDARSKFDLPSQSSGSMSASFRSLGSSFPRLRASTVEEPLSPKSRSPLSRTPTPSALRLYRRSSSCSFSTDTETNPDYTEDPLTPTYPKDTWS
jgi:hypothetical protein